MAKYRVTVFMTKREDEDEYVAFVPLVGGAVAGGKTPVEALENIQDVLDTLMVDATEDDIEALELSRVSQVVVTEVEVEASARAKASAGVDASA